jgi:hypothetical protein
MPGSIPARNASHSDAGGPALIPDDVTLQRFFNASTSLPPKVFVAIPSYGEMPALSAQCLIRLVQTGLAAASMTLRMIIGDSLVSRARNALTADFLASDCTHLLFIDSDLIFSAEQIDRLLAHDLPIVGGFYPKKQQGDLAWVCNAHVDFPPPDERGLQSLRYIGTGFLLVKREVFDLMIITYRKEIEYVADGTGRTEHDLWPVGVHAAKDGGRRYLSEDWFFCQRALDLGYQVYGDPRVILKHIGSSIFPLATQQASIESTLTPAA